MIAYDFPLFDVFLTVLMFFGHHCLVPFRQRPPPRPRRVGQGGVGAADPCPAAHRLSYLCGGAAVRRRGRPSRVGIEH
jgi:hypothetical protein